MLERVLSAENLNNEEYVECSVRPRTFDAYVGQKTAVSQIKIFIEAAIARKESLDHVLLFGAPGLGKTTLANIIANELGVHLRQTSGPVLDKARDLAAILTNLEKNDVLFIDEIHRLSPLIEEILYPAMEDYKIDIIVGEGPSARLIKLELPKFTLIGATTRTGLLTSPLRDRFGIIQRLEFYDINELSEIINRSADILNIKVEKYGIQEIAKRSRGTPRIANRLLRRVRDFAETKSINKIITQEIANNALNLLEIDQCGFDSMDRKLLLAIVEKFEGGPVGIESLASIVNEDKNTIEDVFEPYLLQQGFIVRTARGRIATEKIYLHFGLNELYDKHRRKKS